MDNNKDSMELEELAPVADENRSIPLWSYIPVWAAAMIVVMMFAVGFFAIYPNGKINFIQAVVALALASIVCGFLFVLNAFPGYKAGIPYVVQCRSSFGIKGAKIGTIIRSLPAVCWYGIATWAGGLALNSITQTLWGFGNIWIYFIIFLIINVFLAMGGIKTMRGFNTVAGFILLALMTVGLIKVLIDGDFKNHEAFTYAGDWGFGFLSVFAVGVAIIITGALNVSDMSRHLIKSKGSGNNWWGHMLGIGPAFFYMMVLGVFYGMATGNPDPVAAMMEVAPGILMGVLMMLFVLGAQISSNLTLNILPPAHTLQDVSDKISWKKAVLITSVICLATCPWILFTSKHYFTFMGVYACLLGPILGITLADYWVMNSQKIDIDALYDTKQGSKYWYKGGFSLAAVIALVCGSAASFPVLSLSWMIGLPLSFVLYIILRKAGVDRVAQEST